MSPRWLRSIRYLPLLLIVLTAPLAIAQDSTRIIPIDTLAVTATRGAAVSRLPSAVSVVNREQIQAGRLGLTLDEALAAVPGVMVYNRYNFAVDTRIAIRGFGARAGFGVRGIRLVQDGIPLTMPDGQSTLNNLDLTSAGRIEVLRGAASMLHGNAAGGVIEIHTQSPGPGFGVEARAVAADLGRAGIDDLGRYNLKLGGGSERTRYLLSAARTAARGSRDHARFEQNNLTARIEHGGPAARSALTLAIAHTPVAENPGSLPRDSARLKPQMAWPANITTGAGKTTRQIQAGLEHDRALGEARVTAVAYALTRSLDNPLTFAFISVDRTAGGVRSALTWRWLTTGIDIELLSDERAEYNNVAGKRGDQQRRDQTDRVAGIGPFVRILVPASDRATLTAGVRYDRTHFEVEDRFVADGRDDSGDRTMAALSPSAGITYVLAPGVTAFASVSTSFQTPTTTELINAPPAAGQPCCAAGFNGTLDPERALAFELGVRGRWFDRLTLDAAAYRIRTRDALVPFQVAQAPGRDFYRNAAATRNLGLELAAVVEITPPLQLTTSYTYNRFIYLADGSDSSAFEGNQVPGVAPHHWIVRPAWRTPDVVAEAEAEWTSSYYADDANSDVARNGGATVLNLRVRAARPVMGTGLLPFAALNNLSDRRYSASVVTNAAGARYFEPAPGRNFFVGVELRVGRAGGAR